MDISFQCRIGASYDLYKTLNNGKPMILEGDVYFDHYIETETPNFTNKKSKKFIKSEKKHKEKYKKTLNPLAKYNQNLSFYENIQLTQINKENLNDHQSNLQDKLISLKGN